MVLRSAMMNLPEASSHLGAIIRCRSKFFGMTTNVTTPVLFALGTLTTVFSLIVILVFLMVVWFVNRRRNLQGSDAGKGMV